MNRVYGTQLSLATCLKFGGVYFEKVCFADETAVRPFRSNDCLDRERSQSCPSGKDTRRLDANHGISNKGGYALIESFKGQCLLSRTGTIIG
jgi:hypothetical protein